VGGSEGETIDSFQTGDINVRVYFNVPRIALDVAMEEMGKVILIEDERSMVVGQNSSDWERIRFEGSIV